MESTQASTNNSTNVRSLPWSVRALRTGFQVFGPAAPAIAARMAEGLFFTARRHPRPAWEHEVLEKAEAFRVAYADGFVPIWSWGQGPTVLLVHGWEGRGAQLGKFVMPLVEQGFRVVTFDGPGHGDATASRASMPDLAAAVEQVAAAVGPLHAIVAHSMGGASSLLAISRKVKVSRVVFLAPPIDIRRFVRAFGKTFGLDASVMNHFEKHIEDRFSVSFDDLYAPSLAKRMKAPLLVVHDEEDREVPWISGKMLVDAWPGAELHSTRGLGHQRILKDPEVIARTVAFLSGTRQAAQSETTFSWMNTLI